MQELGPVLSASAAAIAALMLCLWLASLWLRDASIVDLFWGPDFALAAWVGFAVGDGATARQWLVALLTSAWGLRLGTHLYARSRGRGEDRRYRAMRERHGARFGWISLATLFGFQGGGLWAWTRHPNYFGDAVLWWGLFILAYSTPGGAYTAIGPALMTVLLLRVSGVALLERDLRARKPGFADYARRTSAFFPLPPRKRGT